MNTTVMTHDEASQWGVVYGYGSVLAIFANEVEALVEASAFGGAVVKIKPAITGPDELPTINESLALLKE